jgi:hypothetical protein
MADAKIQMKVGSIEFNGEGSEAWLAKQFQTLLDHASTLARIQPAKPQGDGNTGQDEMSPDSGIAKQTLPAYLKSVDAQTKQVRKFLATAVWLEAQGKDRLSTRDVSSALNDSNQARISNPANCLNQNVAKGYCQKDGKKQFFVTEDGKNSLGKSAA